MREEHYELLELDMVYLKSGHMLIASNTKRLAVQAVSFAKEFGGL